MSTRTTPYRDGENLEVDDSFIRPPSRLGPCIGIAVMCGFMAFLYYGLFSAFGRAAWIAVPGPGALCVVMVFRIWRSNDPRAEAAHRLDVEGQAVAQLNDPDLR
jgi:hypothetical protein